MTAGVLVVGYGNPLRTDDGVGWHVADRLALDPRLDGALLDGTTVLRLHQLTPELALDVSAASLVVLVDASHGPPAGTVAVAQVERAGDAGTTWSHHLGPPSLIALAHELYGRAPDVFVVSCGVTSLEIGDTLSPEVEVALPNVVDAVVELIASHAAEPVAHRVSERSDA
jgi:hydrogenase maturation protease